MRYGILELLSTDLIELSSAQIQIVFFHYRAIIIDNLIIKSLV